MLKITHNAGFFSCCTIILEETINYFNREKRLPEVVDTAVSFHMYKPPNKYGLDIKCDYFEINEDKQIEYVHDLYLTNENDEQQFSDYKKLNFSMIQPFIDKYFSPSKRILALIYNMEKKYAIDYANTCAIFYRGNDKCTETILPSYEEFVKKANELRLTNPTIKFWIQSDETEFLQHMKSHFPDSIIMNEEIRHMSKVQNSVDNAPGSINYMYSKYFLGITIMMSKCKHVIANAGNCSLWIALFRGNADNFQEYLVRLPIIRTVMNPFYKESSEVWL